MSRLSMVKSLVLVLLSLVVLGGCGGSGGVDSKHNLVPAPETHVTDTNTTPDTNGTQPDDSNGTNGGGSDDGNTTDVTPPVITLNGEANMTLEQNTTYTEPGAVAVDTVDGNVPVSISGSVDTSTVGHYVVTYSATDHAGNQAHATRQIEVINSALTLTSLGLESNTTTLNKDHNTTLTLTATYSDKSTKPLTGGITWIITPQDALTIHGTTLTARKDVNVTVQAKVGNTLSNKVTLNIYWEVNGHRLPPEPDPKVNNATLLGVDINHNGVRDDVERWIYTKYKEYKICHKQSEGNYTLPDGSVVPVYNVNAKEICSKPIPYHPVVREAVMEIARETQIIIQKPENAGEMVGGFNASFMCASALDRFKDKNGRKIRNRNLFGKDFKAIQFNTVQRARAFAKFNFYLSGGVYELPTDDYILKNWCSPKIKEMIKDLK